MEYGNYYLKPNFCNTIAMVYKKKLSKLNIDILKSIHNKVTSPDIDDSLTMTLQYIPASEDTFMSELFALGYFGLTRVLEKAESF
jgi:hypothetical protein